MQCYNLLPCFCLPSGLQPSILFCCAQSTSQLPAFSSHRLERGGQQLHLLLKQLRQVVQGRIRAHMVLVLVVPTAFCVAHGGTEGDSQQRLFACSFQ